MPRRARQDLRQRCRWWKSPAPARIVKSKGHDLYQNTGSPPRIKWGAGFFGIMPVTENTATSRPTRIDVFHACNTFRRAAAQPGRRRLDADALPELGL